MALHGGLSSVKLSRLLALTVLVLNGSLFRNLTLVGEPGSALFFFCALYRSASQFIFFERCLESRTSLLSSAMAMGF